jgi:cell division septum initiation protein DivIVA
MASMPSMPSGSSEQYSRLNEENASLRSHTSVLESQVHELQARLAATPASNVGVIEGDTRRIVVTTSAEASPAVVLLVQQTLQQVQVLMDNAKREIDQHRAEAEVEARRLVEAATQQAAELSRRAQTDADSLKAEATVTADRVIAEARSRAAAIDTEATERRTQIFGQLEHEKDQLSQRIGQLRDFESQYRSSMAGHLQRQLDSLREVEFAPNARPEIMDPQSRAGYSLGR